MIEIEFEELSQSKFYSNTQLFRNLSESNKDENDRTILIEDKYYMDMDIRRIDTIDTFIKVFHIINYWGSNRAPDILYRFIFNGFDGGNILSESDIFKMKESMESFDDSNTLKNEILFMLNLPNGLKLYNLYSLYNYTREKSIYLYNELISKKLLNLLVFIYDKGLVIHCEDLLHILIIHSNGEEILDYMLKNGCYFSDRMIYKSIQFGSFYLKTFHKYGFKLTKKVCYESCIGLNLMCLQYAIQNGCEYGDKQILINYLLVVSSTKCKLPLYQDPNYIKFKNYVNSLE